MTTVKTMKRIPEPELMDEPRQAHAYAEADFSEPNSRFVDEALSHLRPDANGRLVDLGCGPGDICIRLARSLPGWHITGLDAGPNMLALAERAVEAAGLTERIELVLAHLPEHPLDDRFDAVVSNSLLHHLPDPMVLWRTIDALAGPDAFIQVMDLHRPQNRDEAHGLVEEHANGEPEVLRQDFYNSLCAAWTVDEVCDQLATAGLTGLEISRPTERHWLVQGSLARQ